MLTCYAFSTENWSRDPSEVAALMAIFAKYCDELRVEALERNIRIHVLSTESERVRHLLRYSWFFFLLFVSHIRFAHNPSPLAARFRDMSKRVCIEWWKIRNTARMVLQ